MTNRITGPLVPLADAIADRVVDRLRPLIAAAQGVRPRLLTVAQAAAYLGRTEKSVYAMTARGAFPAVRGDGRVMFDVQDLDQWIETNKVERRSQWS
jgi:excisionase family DNA binding protein